MSQYNNVSESLRAKRSNLRWIASSSRQGGTPRNDIRTSLRAKRSNLGGTPRNDKAVGSHRSAGQLMIESIVGISLVMVGLLGVMTLLIRSSQWNRDVGLKLQATYLAAEGIEVVKNMIDSNVATMLSEGGTTWNADVGTGDFELSYLTNRGPLTPASSRRLSFDSNNGYLYSGGEPSPFTRTVTISSTGTGEDPIRVRAEVSWGLGKKVVLEDVFTFWRKQGAR